MRRKTMKRSPSDPEGAERGLAFGPDGCHWSDDISVCHGLVRAARTIMANDKIGLEMSDQIEQAHTDGTRVFVPRRHPQRRIATKHELSHIYFKSNLQLRLLFVQELINLIEAGVPQERRLSPSARNALMTSLCFFINILDDIRVNSLWGLLYPGDGAQMEEWYFGTVGPSLKAKAQAEYGGDIEDLFTFAILIALRQDVESTTWGEFKEDIESAASNVYFKTFNAALLLTKRLLLKITKRMVEKQQEEKERQEQQSGEGTGGSGDENDESTPWGGSPSPLDADDEEAQQALGASGTDGDMTEDADYDEILKQRLGGPKEPETSATDALKKMLGPGLTGAKPSLSDPNAGFDFKPKSDGTSPPPDRLTQGALRGLNSVEVDNDDAVETALAQQEEAGIEAAERIREKTEALSDGPAKTGNFATAGDLLRKGIKAKVVFHRVRAEEIVPATLSRDDLEAAKRWRQLFLRIQGALAHRTSSVGHELMSDLYVQRRLSGEPLDYYKEETTGRGFRLLVLVDMSGSMYNTFSQVERLTVVLRKALAFPFVKLDVMGFSSTAMGVVDIYQFPKRIEGLTSPSSKVDGVTPLSQAITIAGRTLIGSRDEKHIFVLSDGFPVYADQYGRRLATQALQAWTSNAVADLRRAAVKTWCFMIGTSVPSDHEMDRMFGHHYWRKINTGQVYSDSFEFLREQFVKYLRTR